MSWFVSYASLEALNNNSPDQPAQDCPDDQLAEAKTAARYLIESGVIGKEKDFRINLSGHSNPNHEPASGWANDCIAISVSQK